MKNIKFYNNSFGSFFVNMIVVVFLSILAPVAVVAFLSILTIIACLIVYAIPCIAFLMGGFWINDNLIKRC
jgi:dolichol kinase